MNITDRLGNILKVGDTAIANDPETDQEFLVTIEVIKRGKDGKPIAECSNSDYDIFTFVSEDLEKANN